ncbi:MAG: cytoplasmic protein [Candidatus Zambryskibacteria bacterium]|nr:cytoplasmic protein [Candidatus Zambryskibacteria bacterium]
MQTFLPYSSFSRSAKTLDNRRLGKQRVEAYQILKVNLQGPEIAFREKTVNGQKHYELLWFQPLNSGSGVKKTAWYNHPATKMWRGYEKALIEYGVVICDEWIKRGFVDNLKKKLLAFKIHKKNELPSWLGKVKFHRSHQSNLLRKEPKHYSKFKWRVSNDLNYHWPN